MPSLAPVPSQKFLPMKVELRLPAVDLLGARSLMGMHENQIKELIETGDLPAWDLSARFGGSDHGRTLYRLMAQHCRDYVPGRPLEYDEDKIVLRLYGRRPPVRDAWLNGTRFHRAWNCDSGTMINLVNAGALAVVPGTTFNRGRGCTPKITWESAVAFLRTRRINP